MNKVILTGRIGAEPEIRYQPNGDPITNLRMATSEKWRDKASGEIKETTDWHRVVIFGRKNLIEHLHKGTALLVEGQLKTRKWQDKEGKDQYTTEVQIGFDGVIELQGRPQGQSSGQGSSKPAGNGTPTPPPSSSNDFEDDIPF